MPSGENTAMLRDVVHRVEHRLEALGLSAQAASVQAGLSRDAIRNMQRAARQDDGRQGVSTKTLSSLATVLKTSPQWLLEGVGDEEGEGTVPLVGHVGAGSAAHFYATGDGELDRVESPKNATKYTVAVEIRGDSLGRHFQHWLVYYNEVRSPVTHDLINQLCVVGLPDDRVLVKWIRRARTPGLYHLDSNNEPTMTDVEIVWAARVIHMSPR